jgi:hypothetical protein
MVFNAEHLRRILAKYATCYNEVRTHVSLGKDTPCTRPIERFGDIVAYPILSGLHPSIRNFITNIAESNFRYTQVKPSRFRRLASSNCSHGRIYSASISLSLVLISGLSRKTMFNKELWTSSFPLYSIKPSLRNLFMKKLTRDRVVPIISASVS